MHLGFQTLGPIEAGMCSEREDAKEDLVLTFGSLQIGHEYIVKVQ